MADTRFQSELKALKDEGYRDFVARLIPTVPSGSIIGVRSPAMRGFVKRVRKEWAGSIPAFLEELPHRYLEENTLHALLIGHTSDLDEAMAAADSFLPYVDNWATCDTLKFKAFSGHPEQTLAAVRTWIVSPHPYTARFAIGQLMSLYLDDRFDPALLDLAANVPNEDYYVRMMAAWYFCEALIKQPAAALPFIENRILPPWTHNMAIRKAVESFRIADAQKSYLKTLRVSLRGQIML